ncbi:hypothetical protein FTO74_08750 [Granulicella sp. WH15]|uniref:hypothetical protein n=1 Tax=Granulicella sp. WH15 TaxID=2602070 RepID=UPI0013678A4D|nr:hypothetical protein [Granulicella sp. WH15]QHN03445.1 hypothetical protein FTO74_08750 [Granulicella sp. WH15]
MQRSIKYTALLFLMLILSATGLAQQILQRGPLGKPLQVLDETQQWTTPLLVASDADVEMYIPDVSSPEWLKQNYPVFQDKGQYVISMFTFYRTPDACRANQIGWGLSDAVHLDACIDIGYRLRQALVDTHLKTVTLMMAAMIGQDGQLMPDSLQTQPVSRTWADLDANSRTALEKTSAIVAKQMELYDQRIQGTP